MSTPAFAPPRENCSIARALEVVGEKWTFLVLREAFNGVRRFDEIRAMTGIPRQVLTARLASLVEMGLLTRVPYREPGQRQRHEYRLTAQGMDLYPALVALLQWGDRYLAGPEGAPTRLVHRDCGAEVRLELHCADGHHLRSAREVRPAPGPGVNATDAR
jgi:DNA-binding HxlR family transcriptional regulator